VALGQARLFRVAGSNLPGSVSTSLFDSSVSVSLIHACGGITPCVLYILHFQLLSGLPMLVENHVFLSPSLSLSLSFSLFLSLSLSLSLSPSFSSSLTVMPDCSHTKPCVLPAQKNMSEAGFNCFQSYQTILHSTSQLTPLWC